MSGVDFELDLTGDLERNALDSARALAKLTRQMRSADKQLEALNKHAKQTGGIVGSTRLLGDLNKQLRMYMTPAQRAAEATRKLRLEKKELAEKARLVSDSLNKGRSSVRSMGGAISSLGRRARGLAKGLGLVATAGAAIGAGMFMGGVMKKSLFSQSSNQALELLTGSKESGRQAFEDSISLARTYGLEIEDTTKSMQKLLAQQFSLGESKNLLKLGADMRAIGNSAEDVKGIILAITQIRAKGRLQAQEINQLSERNVSRELIYSSLMAQTGKSRDDVMKMQESGNITSDMALAAIQSAILTKTKTRNPGEAGRAYATGTLSGAMGLFKAEKDNFLLQIAEGAQPAFKSLAGVVAGIGEVFGDKATIETFTKGFKVMGEALERMKPSIVESFKKSLTAAAEIFERLSISSSAFFEGFFDGFAKEMSMFSSAGDDPAAVMERMKATGKSFGEELGKLIVALPKIITLLEKVASIGGKIASTFSIFGVGAGVEQQINNPQAAKAAGMKKNAEHKAWLDDLFNTDFFSTYKGLFESSGANTVDGMIAGMDSRKAALAAKSAEIAAIPVNTWSTMHQEHSPSKLFERKAGNDIKGMILGYNKSSRALFGASASASAGAATAGISAASATAQRAGGFGGGGTNVFHQNFRSDINVNEAQRPGQTANEIASTQSAVMFGAMVKSKVAAGVAA